MKFAKHALILLVVLFMFACNGPTEKNFHKMQYNGHSYIVYDGDNFDGGVLHDPDCLCGWQKR